MTLEEFKALDDTLQAQTVMAGTFLEARSGQGYVIALYAVHSFFVEVFYSGALNEIFQLKPLDSTDQLEPYLPDWDIRNLF